MSTETSSALDQLTMSGATPKHPRDKVMRLATMTKQLLDEVRTQPLDTAGLDRLRTIDTQIIGELLTDLSPDLRQELQRLALPITRHTELSDAELRLAHAQLVGWLQGLLQTTQTAQNVRRIQPPRSTVVPDVVRKVMKRRAAGASRRSFCHTARTFRRASRSRNGISTSVGS